MSTASFSQVKARSHCDGNGNGGNGNSIFLPFMKVTNGNGIGTGIITVRNEVAKVMFLQVSVCPQEGSPILVRGGLQAHSQGGN